MYNMTYKMKMVKHAYVCLYVRMHMHSHIQTLRKLKHRPTYKLTYKHTYCRNSEKCIQPYAQVIQCNKTHNYTKLPLATCEQQGLDGYYLMAHVLSGITLSESAAQLLSLSLQQSTVL